MEYILIENHTINEGIKQLISADIQSTFFGTLLIRIDKTHIMNFLQAIFCCQCITEMPKVVLNGLLSC